MKKHAKFARSPWNGAPDAWLSHLTEHLPAAQAGGDAHAVHEVRIALARLRVWLYLARRRQLEGELKWLRDQVGRVRDLEVQLKAQPPGVLVGPLQARLAEAEGALREALAQPRAQQLLDALHLLPPLPVARIKGRLRRLLRKLRARGRDAAAQPDDDGVLHQLRRAARRLRFALEWVGQRPRKLIALQDVLGQINDRVNTLRYLDEAPPDAEVAAQRARVEGELERLRRKAQRRWRRLRRVLTLKKLLSAKQAETTAGPPGEEKAPAAEPVDPPAEGEDSAPAPAPDAAGAGPVAGDAAG